MLERPRGYRQGQAWSPLQRPCVVRPATVGRDHPAPACLKPSNGSLMRLAPVSVRFCRDRSALRDVAARQSETTHAAPEAIGQRRRQRFDVGDAFAEVLADAIEGLPRSEVLRVRAPMPARLG